MSILSKRVSLLCPVIWLGMLGLPVLGQVRDWNIDFGYWSDSINWSPNLVPGFADLARVGILPNAMDAEVRLSGVTAVGGLMLSNGAHLETNGHNMQTALDTLVTGYGTRDSALEIENSTFGSRDLANHARVQMVEATVNVSRQLTNANFLFGNGNVNLLRNGGTALVNDGTIAVQTFDGVPTELNINQLGTGLMDLDGATGTGYLRAIQMDSTLRINGTNLTDSFSGRMDVRAGSTLEINLDSMWVADANAEINFVGNNHEVGHLQGSDWSLNGTLNVVTDHTHGTGRASVDAATLIGNSANVLIESDNELSFGNTTVNGGNFVVSENAELKFAGATFIRGGNFSTHSQLSSDGAIRLEGLTAWEGNVGFSGVVLQNGNAIVASQTQIDAGILDMDGGGNSNWSISAPLTINADGVDSTISNSFDGSISVFGDIDSKLTINLDQPGEVWTMAGEMTLQNPFNVGFTRVDGSEMRVTGDLNIDGVVGVGGDLHLDNPATITFDHASSLLFTRASTLVAPNANFVGPGTLANVTGDMTLSDGVDLNDVSLENYGRLNLGSDTGLVVVPEFENMASGIFEIDIGGFNLGSERDVLLVGGGGAQLAGTLEVNLVDAGNGLFLPEIGDEFAFLISPGDILGMFANAPVSFAAGQHFYWDVEYNPNDVTLRVSSIGVPEPASLFWLTLLGSGTLFYRRRTADSAGL